MTEQGIRNLMLELYDAEAGFHTYTITDEDFYVSIALLGGAGFIKAEKAGNAEDTYQVRITGAGRDFVERMRQIEKDLEAHPDRPIPIVVSDLQNTMEEHYELRDMDPDNG